MEFKIEKGIPVPEMGRKFSYDDIAKNMSIGDSVEFDSRKYVNSLSAALVRHYGKSSYKSKKNPQTGMYIVWRSK